MSDLEGSQQSLGKKLMRFESCNVFSIEKNLASSGAKVPAIRLKRVVLPAPLGPIRPVIKPVWISRLIPSTA